MTDPVLLFDGHCNLCNGSVQWILRHERRPRLQFASLQSDRGRELLRLTGLDRADIDSLVLVEGQRGWTHSAAVLRTARYLGGAWPVLAQIGYLVPPRLRNWLYRHLAARRYRWFGRQETCWLPRPEWQHRFLK